MADKSDMAEAKLLESGKRARKLISELDRPQLTIDEMANILTLIAVEESTLDRWLSALEQIHEKGAKEFYKQSPTQAQAVGLDSASIQEVDVANNKDPWFIEKVRRSFNMTCRIQFAKKMNKLDALSQIGALAFEDPRDSEKWVSVNPLVWISWAERGNNAVIRGAVKRGKTNFALLLAEYFLATKHFIVASNIIVTGAPENYVYCPKLSDMLITICEARAASKDVLIILDEGGLYWAKIQTIMPIPQKLAKLVLVYGKAHANLLFLSHFEEQIPGIVLKTSTATFEKKSIKEVYVEVSEGIRIKPRLLTAVPATQLKYDPDQLAYFSLDLSVDALFDFWSTIPEGADQWKTVLAYVHKHRGEAGEDLPDPREVAKFLRRRGKSVRDIAEAVGKSVSTVHEWIS
jgi:hypothetical protein